MLNILIRSLDVGTIPVYRTPNVANNWVDRRRGLGRVKRAAVPCSVRRAYPANDRVCAKLKSVEAEDVITGDVR